jgi:hypothetical protein
MRMPLKDSIRMLGYNLKTRNASVVLLPLVTLFIFSFVLPLQGVSYSKIILLPVVLLHVNALALYGTPPSVLLLASSRWESVRLFNFIERGIYPYRIVLLLDPEQTKPARHSSNHWMHFEVDNMRILGTHSWQNVVRRISESVPIIVLDTRLASPTLVEETKQMIEEHREKTLFILADDGSAPSIDAAGFRDLLTNFHSTRLLGVIAKLKELGLSKTTSPDDSPILAQVSYTRNSKRLEKRMMAISRAGIQFNNALNVAESLHGHIPFIMETYILQQRLNGNQGDGTLEVLAQLSEDIAEMERFITKWRNSEVIEFNNVVGRAIDVHRLLCFLQQAVDQAPPIFLQRNEDNIRILREQ